MLSAKEFAQRQDLIDAVFADTDPADFPMLLTYILDKYSRTPEALRREMYAWKEMIEPFEEDGGPDFNPLPVERLLAWCISVCGASWTLKQLCSVFYDYGHAAGSDNNNSIAEEVLPKPAFSLGADDWFYINRLIQPAINFAEQQEQGKIDSESSVGEGHSEDDVSTPHKEK